MRRHLFLLLLVTCAWAQPAPSSIWPERASDLPADSAIREGVLPSGLRYVIRPNAEPKGQVFLRLLVAAGSLHESDDERGLAHFVEHMAFRGTKSHPNGTLATELQRHGIGFGPDNTAFTRFESTIYHLDLPDPGEAMLRLGLSVFREYAAEVTFDAALIERERGVIMSEKHLRDTPPARVTNANMQFLWPDAPPVRREPIGTETSIQQLRREQFVGFYDAWYRPERMVVIVVGDVSADLAEQAIKRELGSVAAHGVSRPEPAALTATEASKPDIRVHTDPSLPGASCLLEHPLREPHGPDSPARRRTLLHRTLAFSMIQRRLAKAADSGDGHPIAPIAAVHEWLPGWTLVSVGGSGRITNWQEFMADLEREHRRAFLHGFTADELRAARLTLATAHDEAVRTASTWPSSWFADRLAAAIVDGSVVVEPATLQRAIAPELEAATLADCLTAFRATWSNQAPHVFVSTNPEFKVTRHEIADALNASRGAAVTAPVGADAVPFAYATPGPAGKVKRQQRVEDLEVDQAEFANGVRLNFKPTKFDADTVNIHVRIWGGKRTQPAGRPGIDLLANHLLPRGGLGRHTYEQLQDVLSGHTISIGFQVQSDAFEFIGRCARRNLELCLQVITAHITDSAYRPDALRHIHALFGSMYTNLAASAGGPAMVFGERTLTGDTRFGWPTSAELTSRTPAEVREWLEPRLRNGPVELSIVGECTWDEARSAVSRTLGTLSPRPAPPADAADRTVKIGKPKKPMHVYTTPSLLKQVAIIWFCPVRDLGDMHHERRCRLLADLIEERMRTRLREELGASYTFSASFVPHEAFPGFSYIHTYAEVSPEQAQKAAAMMQRELTELQKRRFTDDEFERVKAPFVRRRVEDVRSNAYWGYTVLRDAQQHPERLDAARDRTRDCASITRAEVEKLAREYLRPSRGFQFVCYPGRE